MMNREQKIALMHTKKIKKIMKETIQDTKECEDKEFLKKQLKKNRRIDRAYKYLCDFFYLLTFFFLFLEIV
jgi:hypothetical protein